MDTITKNQTQVKANVQVLDATGKLTVTLFGGASVLVGVWAAACFVGAIVSAGPVGVITGYFSAVTGL
jgi:hypothetical protein